MDNNHLNKTLGQLLAQLRRANGYTQVSLAEAMGITPRYLQSVEAGKVAITVEWLNKAYTAMGLHLYILALPEDGHCPRADEAQLALSALHEALGRAAKN
jgi:transcriptional regulator with XRE-family HTH domain